MSSENNARDHFIERLIAAYTKQLVLNPKGTIYVNLSESFEAIRQNYQIGFSPKK